MLRSRPSRNTLPASELLPTAGVAPHDRLFLAKSKSLSVDAVFSIDATKPQGAIRQWGI
jgi:hypothetical protein